MELIFEKSKEGRKGYSLPEEDVPVRATLDPVYRRSREAELPSVTEHEVVRHFTNLSKMNFGVDSHFYPLGSCTMKYNPKFTEKLAGREEFSALHPLLPQLILGGTLTQGALEIIYSLEKALCEITGMAAFTAHPLAGAHGELTGIMLMAAYHKHRESKKRYVLIPDSGHGTNPASAAIAGFQVKSIPSDREGVMDLDAFKRDVSASVDIVLPQPVKMLAGQFTFKL